MRRSSHEWAAFIAAAMVVGGAAAAHASPVTITDYASGPYDTSASYWGAQVPPSPPYPVFTDVVSNAPADTTSSFEIKEAVANIDYSGATPSLTIDIYTNYSAGLDGTSFGDLFLTSAADFHPAGTGPQYATDNLGAAGTSVWDYALVLGSQIVPSGSSTTATAYAVGGNANITPSYVPPGYEYRHDQPVEFNLGTGPGLTTGSLTVSSTGNDAASATGLYQLQFVIDNLGALSSLGNDISGYNFAILWAMTCANDVIAGSLSFAAPPGHGASPVPLPAAFPLFAFALAGIAVAGSRRKRWIS